MSWTSKSSSSSFTTPTTTTMSATSVQSSPVTNVTAVSTSNSTSTVVASTSSAPVFRTYNRTESSVNQTSPYSSAPTTTSSDGLKLSSTDSIYSISSNRTSSTQGQLNHSVELESTSKWTTNNITRTSLPLTSVQLTSLQPYTGNTTESLMFGDNVTSRMMSVTSVISTSLNVTATMTTVPILPVDGAFIVTLGAFVFTS